MIKLLFSITNIYHFLCLFFPVLQYVQIKLFEKCSFFVSKPDECVLLLQIILELPYLNYWNSTFTERFFSIQRQALFNKFHILKSIVQSCIIPYFSNKLDQYYHNTNDKLESNQRITQVEQFFFKFYPILKTICLFLNVITCISYVAGNDHSHSLLIQLLWSGKLKLFTVNQKNSHDKHSKKLFFSKFACALCNLFDIFFILSTFIVQFIQYCNNSEVNFKFNLKKSVEIFSLPKMKLNDHLVI